MAVNYFVKWLERNNMIDCFVATLDLTKERVHAARRVISKIQESNNVRITILDATSRPDQLEWFQGQGLTVVPNPREGSTHRRFLLPEILTLSEYYFLFDDDCLPLTEDWAAVGFEVAQNHPQFGLIGLHKEIGDYSTSGIFQDASLRDVDVVGGAMIVKRGARTAEFKIPSYVDHKLNRMNDAQYSHAIRDSGMLVGQLERVYFKHLDKDGKITTYLKENVKGRLG